MTKVFRISTFTTLMILVIAFVVHTAFLSSNQEKVLKVGFIYEGDQVTPYTDNFIKAQLQMEKQYGSKVESIVKYNVKEEDVEENLKELMEEQCDLVFSTSFGYGETVKKYAGLYPDVQFCQATCYDANVDPIYPNYHNFMSRIYEGRYVTGVVAGLKMKEMKDLGLVKSEAMKVGYVAAFPYSEVISGYTAFLLGVRSVVPEATMMVKYTNTWNDYVVEKNVANELIDLGAIVISQHSDTTGPAVACENANKKVRIYHVGYNQSMTEIAPLSSMVCCNMNYAPYMESAVKALLAHKPIESVVDAKTFGQDSCAGFEKNWVRILDLNETITAYGTRKIMEETIEKIIAGKIQVFQGDYLGVNPYDPTDTYDLKNGYEENQNTSAPMFNYVLKDVITIIE